MARIPRKTQKVFCENANAGQIAIFGTMKTGTPQYSTDLDSLQSAEYGLGWDDAILSDKAPYLEEMNGVQYGFSSQLAYLLQQGMACEYDAGTTYYKGSTVAIINNTDVTYYKAVYDGFSNVSPVGDDGTHWVLDSISKIETYNTTLTSAINTLDGSVVKLSGNQSINGTKTFNAAPKVPDSTTTGTALALTKRGTGYIQLGDGTKIQWGQEGTTSHKKTVSLPLEYTSNYKAIVCDYGSSNATEEFKVQSQDSKKFVVYSSSSSANDTFNWFAIGR